MVLVRLCILDLTQRLPDLVISSSFHWPLPPEDHGYVIIAPTYIELKEVLKCTEEVARQMTLIDHAQLCKISALELLQKVNMVPRPQSQRNSKMSSQSLQSSLSLSSLEQSETAIEKLAFRGLIRWGTGWPTVFYNIGSWTRE
eukprot:Em0006g1071a